MGENDRAAIPRGGGHNTAVVGAAVPDAVCHQAPLLLCRLGRASRQKQARYAAHLISVVPVDCLSRSRRDMKVLILAYDFPPFVSVGGLRPHAWFKYFKEFGVEPVVVTRQWANRYGDARDYIAPSPSSKVVVDSNELGTVIRTPYFPTWSNRILLSEGPNQRRLLRRAITAWYEIGQYYATIGTKVQLYFGARAYLQEHRVDAILATGEPFILFKYAAQLSKEFGVPWIADFRDPWSQDKRRSGTRISKGWEAGIERRLVSSAAMITTPAAVVGGLLGGLHSGTRVEVVPNGYDPQAMSPAQHVPQNRERLTIAFTGSIYGWHPVESVFRVLSDFALSPPGRAFTFNLIGVVGKASESWVRTQFPDLAERTMFTPQLANDQMALALASANAFLMFNNYAYSGTKIFDYLALRRRILLCYSADPEAQRLKKANYNLTVAPDANERVLEEMIEETNSGTVVRDAAHLREVLEELDREFEERRQVACRSAGTEKYSRRVSTESLAGLLKGLVG